MSKNGFLPSLSETRLIIIHGQTENMVESLSRQWKSNGFKPHPDQSNIKIFKQLADIYSKW